MKNMCKNLFCGWISWTVCLVSEALCFYEHGVLWTDPQFQPAVCSIFVFQMLVAAGSLDQYQMVEMW